LAIAFLMLRLAAARCFIVVMLEHSFLESKTCVGQP